MVKLLNQQLRDELAERVRRNHAEAIAELQAIAQLQVIAGVALPNGVTVPIAHGLGRPPRWLSASTPRGGATAGRIEEVRDSKVERSKTIQLRASGFGGDIVVDVALL